MACTCRAMRALTLARTTLPLQTTLPLRPAFAAPRRLYSTTPSDTPSDPPAAASEGASPDGPKPRRRRTSPKAAPPNNVSFNSDTSTPPPEAPAKKRRRRTIAPKDKEPTGTQGWQVQKAALKKKFPLGWAPPKKLSPDAISGLRALHAQFPETYTTPVLSNLFGVSPEAVRRILKSKWSPATAEEEEDRRERWVRRGERVWERWAALGVKVPRKWREEGVSKWGGQQKGAGEREEEKGAGGVRARRRVMGRIM